MIQRPADQASNKPPHATIPTLPVTRFAAVDIADPLERLLVQAIAARPEIAAMVAHDPYRCPCCHSALVDILGAGVITDDRMTVLSDAGLSEIEGLCTINPSPAIATLFECNLHHRWARIERTVPAPHGDQEPHIGMVFPGIVILPASATIKSLTGQTRGIL